MNDEEKKAVEYLENLDIDYNTLFRINLKTLSKAKNTLLNIIEKQQKEIELLQQSNKSFRKQYNQQVLENAKIVNFYENDDLHKELYKNRKEIEDLHLAWDYYKNSYENSIPKSKIQDKIEELDIKITYIESQYTNGGQNCNSNYLAALYQKQVLKELLESEY